MYAKVSGLGGERYFRDLIREWFRICDSVYIGCWGVDACQRFFGSNYSFSSASDTKDWVYISFILLFVRVGVPGVKS